MKSGEVWQADLGLAGKVRPVLLLSGYPAEDTLALITVIPHTTALRGNCWEVSIPKHFLKDGAFHLQQIQSIPTTRLLRRLGVLTFEEINEIHLGLRKYLNF